MAIRNIRYEGDEILRKISKPVKEITPRVTELIEDLKENLHEYDGVGLAAVQIGVLKRIAVICIPGPELDEETGKPIYEESELENTAGKELVLINPVWEAVGDEEQTGSEGCLSVPGAFGQVTRPYRVKLNAYDENMQPYELMAEGLFARAVCHECDHLDGIMYTDKVEGELKRNNPDNDPDMLEGEELN